MIINLSLLVVVLISSAVLCEDLDLLILHNNDMHARFEETSRISGTCKKEEKNKDCVGGFARTAHVIREARKAATEGRGPNVLFLNAGDTYVGTAWFSVHKWKICAEFLNMLAPDAASFGNHEFDQGVAGVLPFINAVDFPVVAANLDFSNEPQMKNPKVKKSVVLEVAGRKIGIIGYLTPDTKQISAPGNIIFKDEVESIKTESEKLDKEGVKVIIALGHSGFDTDKRIAAEVPLVDIVIGGHSNTFLWNGPQPDMEEPAGPYPVVIKNADGKNVPVMQAYAYTKYLGRLNVTINDAGDVTKFFGQPLLLDNSIPQEGSFLIMLDAYRPAVDALNDMVVGRSKVFLDGECRLAECNLGNLITDSFVAYASSIYGGKYWTDSPIAIWNGGGVRNSIDASLAGGNLSMGELTNVLPFGTPIVSFNLNGSDLLATLEVGARSNGETTFGEFLQVSGIHVKYNFSRPAGSRVIAAKVRCSNCDVPKYNPVESGKAYRVMTGSFLTDGGDGFDILKNKASKMKIEELNDIGMVSWYIEAHSPIYPEEQERIVVYGKRSKVESLSKSPSNRGDYNSPTSVLCVLVVVLFFAK